MKCRDCNCKLNDKYIPFTIHTGSLALLEGICLDCGDKYNSYKHHDGKERDFCEKCGEKFLTEDLSEVIIKKIATKVCPRCREER